MGIEYLNNKQFEINIAKYIKCKKDKIEYESIIGSFKETKSKKKLKLLEETNYKYKLVLIEFKNFSDQLAVDFFKIAEGIISYRKFHFVDSDDAIQEFVMTCFQKIDRFDPNYVGKNGQKAKAFNYITTCILNHYRQLYRSARNYNEFKRKYHDHLQVKTEGTPTKSKSNLVSKDKFMKNNN